MLNFQTDNVLLLHGLIGGKSNQKLNQSRIKTIQSGGTLYEINNNDTWKLQQGNDGSFEQYDLNNNLLLQLKFTNAAIPKGIDHYTGEYLAYNGGKLEVYNETLTLLRKIPYNLYDNADLVYATQNYYLFIFTSSIYIGDKNGNLKSSSISFNGTPVVRALNNHDFLCTSHSGNNYRNKIIKDDGTYVDLSNANPILFF
ncbi:hypothetical protein CF095_18410 [Clostridium botulinum]